MQLIFDIGNSNIVIAVHREGSWGPQLRIETKNKHSREFYLREFSDYFLENNISVDEIEEVIVSSVVSEIDEVINETIFSYFGRPPKLIGPEHFLKLPFHITRPYEIGSDLVSNACAVFFLKREDCIIVDFGTALTFTVLTMDGGIVGVTIAPGLNTSINALSSETSRLPEVPVRIPESVIGKNTTHAIQAGVLYGYVGLIKEITARIKEEMGMELKVVATGGMSEVLSTLGNFFDEIDRNLTLDGIRLIGLNY